MMKLNELKAIAFLVVGLMVHGAIHAEYAADASYNADLGRLGSVLKPAASVKLGKSFSTREELENTLLEAEKLTKVDPKEASLRGEVEAKRKNVDFLKKETQETKTTFANATTAAKTANEKLQAAWAQIPSATTQANEASDMDTSGLEPACSEKVDTQQFLSLSSQMKSEPFNFLRREGGKMLAEKNKELKAKTLENFQTLLKQLRENNKKRDEVAVEDENKKRLEEIAALTEGGSEEQRLNSLQEDKKKFSEAEQVWTEKLLAASDSLVKDLAGLKDSSDKIQAVMEPFVANLDQYRDLAQKAAKKAADQVYANCKRQAEQLGRDNPRAQNTSLATAYGFLVAYAKGDSSQFADSWLQAMSSEARVLQCKKASKDIENQFGAPMQARIAQLRSPTTDPNVALQGALAVMTSLGTAGSEVAKSFDSAKKSCNRIAKLKKKVDEYATNIQSLVAQTAQQFAPGVRRQQSPGLNNALATAPQTHFGQQQAELR